MSKPYLYSTEHAQLILVPDEHGEQLRFHLVLAGIRSDITHLPGLKSQLISFDGDADVVRKIVEGWKP